MITCRTLWNGVKRAWIISLTLVLLQADFSRVSAFTASDAASMISSFNGAFHFSSNGGTSFRNTTSGGEVWFWGRANQMEMILDVYERTTNSLYLTQFTNLFNGFVADYGQDWIWNEFNDDIMWMVIACARAYQLTGNTAFRNAAKNNFDSCYARAWSSDLGGGLWWKSPLNTSKNACVNGPAAIAAYFLSQIYNDTNYLAKAHAIYQWERNNLFNPANGQIYDSMHYTGSKDTTPITYNQGTFIGAAHYLGYTNDALLAANYTKNSMTTAGGILPQYDEDNDLGGFNGIFLRWMGKYMRERGLEASFQPFLQQNANAAWNSRRTSDRLSWTKWRQPTPPGTRWSFGCWGSVLALHVVPPTQIPNAPAVLLNASDTLGTSSFRSGLNWSGSVVPSVSNSFVVSGRDLRTPADNQHHQFMGSSLTISNGGLFRLAPTTSGRVITVGTELILDNGTVTMASGQSAELTGLITLRSGGGVLDAQNTILTVSSRIAGPGMLTVDSINSSVAGTIILSGDVSHTGGTLINSAQTLQLGGLGRLGPTNASLMFSNTANHGFGVLNLNSLNLDIGNLAGSGGRIANSGSTTNAVLSIGNGNTGGGTFQGAITDRLSGSGTLSLIKRGTGTITLSGVNTYTGGTTVSGGTLQLGDGAVRTAWIVGPITNNAHLHFANPAAQTITADITGTGRVTKSAGGVLALHGTNTFNGGLLISGGTVQIGDGLFKPGGLVGNVTNDSMLVFASSADQVFSGIIRGTGSLVKQGSGRLALSGAHTLTGGVTVNAGTLALTNLGSIFNTPSIQIAASGTLDASGRTDARLTLFSGQTLSGDGTVKGSLLAASGSLVRPGSSIGVLTVANNVTLQGELRMELDREHAQKCDRLFSGGAIAGGGSLVISNAGAALQPGDLFQLFDQPVSGFTGVILPEPGPGLQWTNRLALDGSVEIVRVVASEPAPLLVETVPGGMTLSWPEGHIGWTLQQQTNLLTDGFGTNWFDVPGSSATNRLTLPVDPAQESVFFRLILR